MLKACLDHITPQRQKDKKEEIIKVNEAYCMIIYISE